jgi:hypothetical protein
MTERHAAYIVVLNNDIRDDAAGEIITALRMVRGVASIEPVTAEPFAEQTARIRRDRAWQEALAATSRAMMLQGL